MGTLTNKHKKCLKSIDNKLVSDQDTTLTSKIGYFRRILGRKSHREN